MRRILCALTLAAYPIGGVLADAQTSATEIAVHGSHDAKVTLVYEHELPNVPGKSVKGVLVEYGPGGAHPPRVRVHLRDRPRGRDRQQGQRRAGDGVPDRRELVRAARRSSCCQQECKLDRAGAPPGSFCP